LPKGNPHCSCSARVNTSSMSMMPSAASQASPNSWSLAYVHTLPRGSHTSNAGAACTAAALATALGDAAVRCLRSTRQHWQHGEDGQRLQQHSGVVSQANSLEGKCASALLASAVPLWEQGEHCPCQQRAGMQSLQSAKHQRSQSENVGPTECMCSAGTVLALVARSQHSSDASTPCTIAAQSHAQHPACPACQPDAAAPAAVCVPAVARRRLQLR
jgi:hypothetical protein